MLLDFGVIPNQEEEDHLKLLKDLMKKNQNEITNILASLSDKINNIAETVEMLRKQIVKKDEIEKDGDEKEKFQYVFTFNKSNLSFSLQLEQWIDVLEVFLDNPEKAILGNQRLNLEMYSSEEYLGGYVAEFSLLDQDESLYRLQLFPVKTTEKEIVFPITLKGNKYVIN